MVLIHKTAGLACPIRIYDTGSVAPICSHPSLAGKDHPGIQS